MHRSSSLSFGFVCLGLSALALPLGAIQPEALAQRLGLANPPRIIDVRATHDFEIAHIPGALNIPLEVLSRRTLPPLGEVVVVADGQGVVDAAAAVAILNGREGIKADVLEGGLAAWESGQRLSTRSSGLSQESLPGITYQQLLNGKESDLVLVDLRTPEVPMASLQTMTVQTSAKTSTTAVAPAATLTAASGPDPIANLAGKLRGAKVAGDPFAANDSVATFSAVSANALPSAKLKTTAVGGTPTAAAAAPAPVNSAVAPLLVLIDQGDGRAEETARRLLASGNRRFVILSGGVEAVRLEGHAMIERTGGAINLGGIKQ